MEPRLALSSLAIILPFLAKMHDAGHDPIDDAGGSAAADACTRPSRGVGAGCVLIITRIKVESSSRLITVHLNQAFTRRARNRRTSQGRSTKLDFLPHRTRAVRSGGPVAPALLRPLTFVHATPRAAHHQILYSRPFRVWAARVFDSVTVCIRSLLQSWSWTSGLRSRLSSGCPYPWSARRALFLVLVAGLIIIMIAIAKDGAGRHSSRPQRAVLESRRQLDGRHRGAATEGIITEVQEASGQRD